MERAKGRVTKIHDSYEMDLDQTDMVTAKLIYGDKWAWHLIAETYIRDSVQIPEYILRMLDTE